MERGKFEERLIIDEDIDTSMILWRFSLHRVPTPYMRTVLPRVSHRFPGSHGQIIDAAKKPTSEKADLVGGG
ncbi:uncharacterized protein Z518_08721 [Rhinocladiella mackenziei CBS 650.93]|uniref:Uncharacterized protein n=1 Tax=Rhinocladiella mackenziei CBS 650.93 TaxID=1442369 RepID=A0A0D2IA84_9EURO|nr:uncharacterized protein Z518_08721 [Rhinocladiella mackenziei CBS 650.93]KIX02779.1 hypothetical protein Z518_08721 [Rhinocladiella mackenziei CBS 650.93]